MVFLRKNWDCKKTYRRDILSTQRYVDAKVEGTLTAKNNYNYVNANWSVSGTKYNSLDIDISALGLVSNAVFGIRYKYFISNPNITKNRGTYIPK